MRDRSRRLGCGRRPSGIGLIELLLVLTLLTVVSYISFVSLHNGVQIWRRIMGSEEASLQLAKAQAALERELKTASLAKVKVDSMPGTGPGALPSGTSDGGVVWFLSARDQGSGSQVVDALGDLVWQRNIIYYLAVPRQHAATFGIDCQGGAGPNDQDDRCPHKVLVRKVVDAGSVTTPTSNKETLLSAGQVKAYLTRPAGFEVTDMLTENKLEDVKVVAHNLLTFNVRLDPSPDSPSEVVIDMQAVGLKEAGKSLVLGPTPLSGNQYTRSRRYSLYPMNSDG